MAAFGDDLAKHALTDKWLMTAGKQLIRTQVLQTAAPPRKQKRVPDEDQKEAVPGLSKRPRKSMAQKGTQQVWSTLLIPLRTPPLNPPHPLARASIVFCSIELCMAAIKASAKQK